MDAICERIPGPGHFLGWSHWWQDRPDAAAEIAGSRVVAAPALAQTAFVIGSYCLNVAVSTRPVPSCLGTLKVFTTHVNSLFTVSSWMTRFGVVVGEGVVEPPIEGRFARRVGAAMHAHRLLPEPEMAQDALDDLGNEIRCEGRRRQGCAD